VAGLARAREGVYERKHHSLSHHRRRVCNASRMAAPSAIALLEICLIKSAAINLPKYNGGEEACPIMISLKVKMKHMRRNREQNCCAAPLLIASLIESSIGWPSISVFHRVLMIDKRKGSSASYVSKWKVAYIGVLLW
jgi:hypothetical protein